MPIHVTIFHDAPSTCGLRVHRLGDRTFLDPADGTFKPTVPAGFIPVAVLPNSMAGATGTSPPPAYPGVGFADIATPRAYWGDHADLEIFIHENGQARPTDRLAASIDTGQLSIVALRGAAVGRTDP